MFSEKIKYAVIAILLLLLVPALAMAQESSDDEMMEDDMMAMSCAQDYVVQAGDSLSRIANSELGNSRAFSAIVDATNEAAANGNYNMIDDPSLIRVGWTLCIPDAEEVQMMMDNSMTDDGMMSDDDMMMEDDMMSDTMMDDDMMMDDGMMTSAVLATSNPGDLANDMFLNLTPSLDSMSPVFGGFSNISSIQSVTLADDGTAYFTYDAPNSMGGVLVLDEWMDARALSDARTISGATAGLTAPKGLQVVEELNLILVADFGAQDIKVFSTDAMSNAAPLFTVTDLGGDRSIWDIHHDYASDRLFATGTDGAVLVYDDFSDTQGAMGPDRVITPVDGAGTKLSVNLHGVDYAPTQDTLILTDVGDAGSATDGQIFTIANASTATNTAPVQLRIMNEMQLGNPVDVVFDGTNIYVAEKSNDMVLRYDNILNRMDMGTVSADQATTVTKAESVTLMR